MTASQSFDTRLHHKLRFLKLNSANNWKSGFDVDWRERKLRFNKNGPSFCCFRDVYSKRKLEHKLPSQNYKRYPSSLSHLGRCDANKIISICIASAKVAKASRTPL
jgi:hypothetical protein